MLFYFKIYFVIAVTDSYDIFRTDETFSMLQHVCTNHLDKYDWFVRAVDDCYIRPDKLANTLSFVDKKKKVQVL